MSNFSRVIKNINNRYIKDQIGDKKECRSYDSTVKYVNTTFRQMCPDYFAVWSILIQWTWTQKKIVRTIQLITPLNNVKMSGYS